MVESFKEMNENTENLLVDKNEKPKKKSKKKLFIIIGIVVALLIVGGGVYGYFYFQDSEYNKQIALGNQYLDEEKFSDAVIAFNDAIQISDKKPEGYEGLAKADTYTGDIKGANEAYLKLYELTDDAAYQNRADAVFYGNTNGNVVNGGNVVEQVDTSYILENGVTQANIWKEKNGNQENVKTVEITDRPVENLNIQGRNLYYLNNGKLYSHNLDTSEEKSFEIENILEYLIYSDRIYYLTENALVQTDVDGANQKDIITFDQTSFKFIYENNTIYLATTDADRTSSKLYSVSIDSPELVELYSSDSGVITGLVYKDSKILFKLTSAGGEASEALYQLDPSTKEVVELIKPGVVSSINVDDDNLFYITNGTLFKADLDGKNESEISDVPQQETTEYYAYEVNSINVTSNNVYVINSVSEDEFSNVGYKNEILTTNVEDPSQLDSIILSGNTEELVDPEPKVLPAFEEIINQYRSVINGGSSSREEISKNKYTLGYNGGYLFYDINGDGLDDLLIGTTVGSEIINIYLNRNSEAYLIYSKANPDHFTYLTNNNNLKTFEETFGQIFKINGFQIDVIRYLNFGEDPDLSQEVDSEYPTIKLDFIAF